MVEVGGVMDVVCQKSGERRGARRCPDDQYWHIECINTAYALNEPTVLSVNYTPGHTLAFLTLR